MLKNLLSLTFLAFSLEVVAKDIDTEVKNMTLEQQIAQRIMLDFRYYCKDPKTQMSIKTKCKSGVTQLPDEIRDLITETGLGGVIFFADNLSNAEQIVKLTSQLQNAALSSALNQPLFISIDQEGGRVVRLPREISTSFTGNMSVGATYEKSGVKYAKKVGQIVGAELQALGINVNHSPDVDVNMNANNPVINVRSFGENPEVVAKLGHAMLEGIQKNDVMATLKHFPGHGDTSTDSHTGLPVVNHDVKTVENVDLYPFQWAIDQGQVKMIMTAHIQYPALDDSKIVNKKGESMLKPATLSKKILTDLLRDKMGYKGLVITDALDMAGIADFFTPDEAVIETFKAGSDIALMPVKIRKPSDIPVFKEFLSQLADKIKAQGVNDFTFEKSVERILNYKKTLPKSILSEQKIAEKVAFAQSLLAKKSSRQVELELASEAIVDIKNNLTIRDFSKIKNVLLVFPKQQQTDVMVSSINSLHPIQKWHVTASNFRQDDVSSLSEKISESDLVVVATSDQKTAVELGGVEDLSHRVSGDKLNFANEALQILTSAKKQNKYTVLVALKTPYNLEPFYLVSDRILATFDGETYLEPKTQIMKGPAFEALAKIITGLATAKGVLPVSL